MWISDTAIFTNNKRITFDVITDYIREVAICYWFYLLYLKHCVSLLFGLWLNAFLYVLIFITGPRNIFFLTDWATLYKYGCKKYIKLKSVSQRTKAQSTRSEFKLVASVLLFHICDSTLHVLSGS